MPAHAPLPDDPIELARANWVRHGWDDAADGMALVTSVMRVQQVFLARIEAILRPYGLTFARYEVLRLLAFTRRGAMPVGKIGERLQVHPASVTNAVQRLEARRPRASRSPTRTTAAACWPRSPTRAAAWSRSAPTRLNAEVFADRPDPGRPAASGRSRP